MRIERPKPSDSFQLRYDSELRTLLSQPPLDAQRPCAGCDLPCPCSGSQLCACACSSACPHARHFMSSDPENHPIEPGIAPLVFSVLLLRVCCPCWSCEGHEDAAGRITRLPQIWFYAETETYPRLIYAALLALRFEKRIAHAWQVSIGSVGGDDQRPLFTIAPEFALGARPTLSVLRNDITVIAGEIVELVFAEARRALRRAGG